MPRRGLWIVPLLVGCIAAAAFVVLRLGSGSSIELLRRASLALRRSRVATGVTVAADIARDRVVENAEEENEASEPTVFPQEDSRAEIARTNAAYLAALLEADADAYAATYLEEALAVPPHGAVLRGRKAIEEAILATFATYRFVSAEMARIDVRLLGETAIETGHYRYDVACPSTGDERTLSGRYAIVWKRHENAWRIALDTTQPGVFA